MLQRLLSKRWNNPFPQICNRTPNHFSTSIVSAASSSSSSSSGVVSDHYHDTVVAPNNFANWVSDNKLFQKYPRLLSLEQQCKSLNQLIQILSYVFVSGLHRNPFVMSRVLYSCIFGLEKEGFGLKFDYGSRVFSQIDKPNIFTWNTMIRAFAKSDNSIDPAIPFGYYVEMLCRGVFPDKYTYPFLLQACGSNSDLCLAKQVHNHAVKLGFDMDLFVQNSLLNVYIVCGSILEGKQIFDEMLERDVVSWTTLISGLVDQGCHMEGLLMFNRMMISEVIVRPNVATMVSVMSACASLGSLDHTRGLHAYIEKMGWNEVDVSIRNSLIVAYSKCGSIRGAGKMFYEMHCHQRDTYSWTAMIAGLAMNGCGKEAIKCFSQMKQAVGVVPDAVTFIAVLSACAHAGLVDDGLQIFESMEMEFGIVPDLKHYGCMVDLFSRAGLLEYAFSFLERMPMEPNLATLGSLLSACRVHNNVKLGEAIMMKIKSSCEYGGGAHVLLSNIYANENRWSEVAHVREGMREGEERKEKHPGQSWIAVKAW